MEEKQNNGMSVGGIVLLILFVLVIGTSGSAMYFYRQWSNVKNDPQKAAQEEVTVMVAEIGKIMVLPEGEQPTLATVNDLSKLADQPFFAKAKAGDKVLLYPNARKAILYDPVAKKIIEVAPLNIGNP